MTTGGELGSGTASISEQITITNLTNQILNFHFFQYSNFQLSGTVNDDSVGVGDSTAVQTDPYNKVVETVTSGPASHFAAGSSTALLDSLNDTSATTLDDNNSWGPGDAGWAYQWDYNLAALASAEINKVKTLTPIPEPATLLLVGSSLLGLGFYGRRRIAKGV